MRAEAMRKVTLPRGLGEAVEARGELTCTVEEKDSARPEDGEVCSRKLGIHQL